MICGNGKNPGEAVQMMEVQKVLFEALGMVHEVTEKRVSLKIK